MVLFATEGSGLSIGFQAARSLLLFIEKMVDFGHEFVHVLEFKIHGGKP